MYTTVYTTAAFVLVLLSAKQEFPNLKKSKLEKTHIAKQYRKCSKKSISGYFGAEGGI
ncbi:MAG: hypothetical protein V8R55_12170 [Dysosmobacter sp.]